MALYEALFQGESDFLKGAQAVIEGMLQSPAFLFWMEDTPRAEWKPYATASRLAYSCGTPCRMRTCSTAPPRANWMRSRGGAPPAKCWPTRGPSWRSMSSPRSGCASIGRWRRRASGASFPMFSRELVTSMLEEARRFVGDLVWNDRNFMDVFRASYGFVNADLASVYKVPAPARDFDRTRISGRPGKGRSAGAGAVPYADQQAGRYCPHGARPVRAGAVPVPAGAASSGGRRYQSCSPLANIVP